MTVKYEEQTLIFSECLYIEELEQYHKEITPLLEEIRTIDISQLEKVDFASLQWLLFLKLQTEEKEWILATDKTELGMLFQKINIYY